MPREFELPAPVEGELDGEDTSVGEVLVPVEV